MKVKTRNSYEVFLLNLCNGYDKEMNADKIFDLMVSCMGISMRETISPGFYFFRTG